MSTLEAGRPNPRYRKAWRDVKRLRNIRIVALVVAGLVIWTGTVNGLQWWHAFPMGLALASLMWTALLAPEYNQRLDYWSRLSNHDRSTK